MHRVRPLPRPFFLPRYTVKSPLEHGEAPRGPSVRGAYHGRGLVGVPTQLPPSSTPQPVVCLLRTASVRPRAPSELDAESNSRLRIERR